MDVQGETQGGEAASSPRSPGRAQFSGGVNFQGDSTYRVRREAEFEDNIKPEMKKE